MNRNKLQLRLQNDQLVKVNVVYKYDLWIEVSVEYKYDQWSEGIENVARKLIYFALESKHLSTLFIFKLECWLL